MKMKVLTVRQLRNVNPQYDKDESMTSYGFHHTTSNEIRRGYLSYNVILDQYHELIVYITMDTGNVNLEIKSFTKPLTTSTFKRLQPIENTIHQFTTENGLTYINQPNSIWLPELVFKQLFTNDDIIDRSIDAIHAIWSLAQYHNVTTTNELMGLLNQYSLDVNYATDILRYEMPNENEQHDKFSQLHAIIEIHHQELQKPTNTVQATNTVAVVYANRYQSNLYYALMNPNRINLEQSIIINDDLTKRKDEIKTFWDNLVKNRDLKDHPSTFKLNNQYEDKMSKELLNQFYTGILTTPDGYDMFDILIANTDYRIKHLLSEFNNVVELSTLQQHPQYLKYLKNHQYQITTQLNYESI